MIRSHFDQIIAIISMFDVKIKTKMKKRRRCITKKTSNSKLILQIHRLSFRSKYHYYFQRRKKNLKIVSKVENFFFRISKVKSIKTN